MIHLPSHPFGARRSLLSVVAVTLLMLATRPSFAEQKTYMGAFCNPTEKGKLASFSADAGTIRNTSSFTETVLCPIVKTVSDDVRIEAINLYVDHGTSSKTTSCELKVYSSLIHTNGDHTPIDTDASGEVTGTGVLELSLGSTASSFTGAAWGTPWYFYQIECRVPAGGRIRNYYVNETGTRSDSRKIYPPSMCRFGDEETTSSWVHMNGWIQPRLQTIGDSAAMVCPIVTERKNNTSGMKVVTSFGRAATGAPYSPTCYVYSRSNYFGITDSASSTISNSLSFPSVNITFDLDSSPTWGMYYMVCYMPGTGDFKVVSYRSEERGSAESESNDAKVYNPAQCSGNPYAPNTLNKANRTSHGWFGNLSQAGYAQIWCPIIGDHYGSTTGLSRVRAYIAETNVGSSTTNCNAYSYGNTETTPFSSHYVQAVEPSAGSSVKNQYLDLPLDSSPSNARYLLNCNLASTSSLYEYEIEER